MRNVGSDNFRTWPAANQELAVSDQSRYELSHRATPITGITLTYAGRGGAGGAYSIGACSYHNTMEYQIQGLIQPLIQVVVGG